MREAGASDKEITQAISDATAVRDSAREIMEDHGLKHLGISKKFDKRSCAEETTRIKELVCTAAAYALNCTTNLERHIAAAATVGITESEIRLVLDAATFIKGEAAHYVGEIVKLKDEKDRLQQLLDELQATQAQLVQSEKMAALGKLVAGMVHEMNTPVGVINSATDVSTRSITKILKVLETSQTFEEIRNSQQLQNSLKAIQNNNPIAKAASERISRIINSLKSFIRLDEATFQKIDLHQCLENTLTLLEHDCGDQIRVVKKVGDISLIACYPDELNQVFMHLLTNAIQAIPEKGTITIRTYMREENVHVEITDTGVGISAEQMQQLFEPGFTRKDSRMKAGLGLFTSYNIMQKHRGEIKVDSQVGKGSTFTVILPTDLDKKPRVPEIPSAVNQTSRCDRLKT
ncbi:MAG: hypothetical protein GWN14_12125 [candidate division Zixibacteria bacterium]|nr:hypothetical protein [candidate division Zixibacteria bacterium]